MRRRAPLGFERRIVLTALLAIVPLAAIALIATWRGGFDTKTIWTVAVVALLSILIVLFVIHDQLSFPLRTLANIVAAIREEDYSLRGRTPDRNDALGEVMHEINTLSAMLEERKLEAVEATALLRAVLSEVDAAIFAFDGEGKLRLVNRAGVRLVGSTSERLTGSSAMDLGLHDLLDDDAPVTVERSFPGASGRWSVRRSTFREKGLPHQLLVITDITRELREEETQAWQRLVRVLSHELNNSLAPIKSIAQTLETLSRRDPLPDDWREDVSRGANVIATRADALTRFTRAYAQLARLPRPILRPVDIAAVARRVVSMQDAAVSLSGEPLIVEADQDQIEQVLINLVKNGVEATAVNGGGVAVRWFATRGDAVIEVLDEGPGLQNDRNLFVPFFTTKPGGSGIGLVLSRQIAEAHGGTLTLENRADGGGCVARLTLPRDL